jgi:Flp pilus assembly protein CpaB
MLVSGSHPATDPTLAVRFTGTIPTYGLNGCRLALDPRRMYRVRSSSQPHVLPKPTAEAALETTPSQAAATGMTTGTGEVGVTVRAVADENFTVTAAPELVKRAETAAGRGRRPASAIDPEL